MTAETLLAALVAISFALVVAPAAATIRVCNAALAEADDWRRGPDPRACDGCGAALTACEARRLLSGRPCCPTHAHPVREGKVS